MPVCPFVWGNVIFSAGIQDKFLRLFYSKIFYCLSVGDNFATYGRIRSCFSA